MEEQRTKIIGKEKGTSIRLTAKSGTGGLKSVIPDPSSFSPANLRSLAGPHRYSSMLTSVSVSISFGVNPALTTLSLRTTGDLF